LATLIAVGGLSASSAASPCSTESSRVIAASLIVCVYFAGWLDSLTARR
jgi:hypothetical protein